MVSATNKGSESFKVETLGPFFCKTQQGQRLEETLDALKSEPTSNSSKHIHGNVDPATAPEVTMRLSMLWTGRPGRGAHGYLIRLLALGESIETCAVLHTMVASGIRKTSC